jgi:hypothetical protein
MRVDPRRLRGGEALAGFGAALMAVALFGLTWYGAVPGHGGRDGWTGATHMRWLLLVALGLGLGLAVAQMACRAPALPASLSVLSTVVALLAVLWLLVRVVIDSSSHQQAGAWLELLGAVLVLGGSYASLRQEGIAPRDGPQAVPVIDLITGRPG